MRRAAALAFTLAGVAASAMPAAAEDWVPDQPSVCNGQPTTIAIMDCWGRRTKLWDARLNQAYRALTAVLQQTKSDRQLADLKQAQRLWIQYRDANCGFYGDQEGTIREVEGADCLRRMTQDRAIELQEAGPQ